MLADRGMTWSVGGLATPSMYDGTEVLSAFSLQARLALHPSQRQWLVVLCSLLLLHIRYITL